jgi:hypothetical protein
VPPYFPSTENARRTLPGMLPRRAYPEFTNNIPPFSRVLPFYSYPCCKGDRFDEE